MSNFPKFPVDEFVSAGAEVMVNEHPQHQTVAWLIKELKQFNPKSAVRFATQSNSGLCLLSIYDANEGDVVWVDVGLPDE